MPGRPAGDDADASNDDTNKVSQSDHACPSGVFWSLWEPCGLTELLSFLDMCLCFVMGGMAGLIIPLRICRHSCCALFRCLHSFATHACHAVFQSNRQAPRPKRLTAFKTGWWCVRFGVSCAQCPGDASASRFHCTVTVFLPHPIQHTPVVAVALPLKLCGLRGRGSRSVCFVSPGKETVRGQTDKPSKNDLRAPDQQFTTPVPQSIPQTHSEGEDLTDSKDAEEQPQQGPGNILVDVSDDPHVGRIVRTVLSHGYTKSPQLDHCREVRHILRYGGSLDPLSGDMDHAVRHLADHTDGPAVVAFPHPGDPEDIRVVVLALSTDPWLHIVAYRSEFRRDAEKWILPVYRALCWDEIPAARFFGGDADGEHAHRILCLLALMAVVEPMRGSKHAPRRGDDPRRLGPVREDLRRIKDLVVGGELGSMRQVIDAFPMGLERANQKFDQVLDRQEKLQQRHAQSFPAVHVVQAEE